MRTEMFPDPGKGVPGNSGQQQGQPRQSRSGKPGRASEKKGQASRIASSADPASSANPGVQGIPKKEPALPAAFYRPDGIPLYWSFRLRLITSVLLLVLLFQWLLPLESLKHIIGLYHIKPLFPLIGIALATGAVLLPMWAVLVINGVSCLYAVMNLYYGLYDKSEWLPRLFQSLMSDGNHLMSGRLDLSGELRTLLLYSGVVLLACTIQTLVWARLWGPGLALGTGVYLLHMHWVGGVAVEASLLCTAGAGLLMASLMTYIRAVRYSGSGMRRPVPLELRRSWPVRWWASGMISVLVLIAIGWGAAVDKPRLMNPVSWPSDWSLNRLLKWHGEPDSSALGMQEARLQGMAQDHLAGQAGMTGYSAYNGRMGSPLVANDRPVFIGISPLPLYWRGDSLDYYDGGKWSQSLKSEKLTAVGAANSLDQEWEASGSGNAIVQTVVLEKPDREWPLFHSGSRGMVLEMKAGETPASAYLSDVQADTLRPYTPQPIGVYTVRSVLPDSALLSETDPGASDSVIPSDIAERYLQLPDALPQRITGLAAEITEGVQGRYAKAKALESYLKTAYSYTLSDTEMPKHDQDFVDHFLFEQKQGYCVHFSTAMVVMLRTQGIPARWVKGFATGEPIGEQAVESGMRPMEYQVRSSDAHAWVEVYFPEAGWVSFDPTPGYDGPLAGLAAVGGQSDSGSLPADGSSNVWNVLQLASAAQFAKALFANWVAITALFLIVCAITVWLWSRRHRTALNAALRLYNRAYVSRRGERRYFLLLTEVYWNLLYGRFKRNPLPAMTAREYAASLQLPVPEMERLEQFIRWEEQARYGGTQFTAPAPDRLFSVLFPLPETWRGNRYDYLPGKDTYIMEKNPSAIKK